MRAVLLSAAVGATSVPYTVEKDCDLVGATFSKTGALSYAADDVLATFSAPTVTQTKNSFICGMVTGGTLTVPNLRFTLYAGEVISLISSGGVSVIMYFEDRT